MTGAGAMPRRGRRIVDRLVLVTLVAGLGSGAAGAFLLQRSSSSSALDDARERNRSLAEQYAVRLDARVDNLVGTLLLMSTRADVASVTAAAETELRVVLRASPVFDELVVYDTAGRPVAAAASRFLTDADDYPAAPDLAAEASTTPVVDIDDAAPARVRVAVPIENPPGTVAGALVGFAPLETVSAPLETVIPRGDPIPFLVADDGTVLVHRDRSRVVGADRFPIDAVRDADDGVRTLDLDGEDTLFAATPSERLAAAVVVEQDEDAARAAVEENLRELLVILVAAVVSAVVAVIAAGEWLLRPLGPLTRAVTRLGRGDRDVRTGVSGYGEIQVLAGEIDRMATALDRRDDQLAELRELSLLIGSLADRADVAERVASGAAKLIHADGAAVCAVGDDAVRVEASAGTLTRRDDLDEIVARAARTRGAARGADETDGPNILVVPLTGADDEPLGAIVVNRRTPRFDADEEDLLVAFASFAAVAVDNARRLALQRALADQLQEAVDRRRDLIGTITHEFRTPLACIEGFSTALVDGWDGYDDTERRELVERIGHHSEELDELVNRFLDFTVTERGGLSAHLGTVALDAAVSQAMEALAPLLAERRTAIDVAPITVAADPVLLRRTLANLVSNAVKYSTPGTTVTVRGRVDGDMARVEVADEGVGLSPDDARRAFEPFWRGGAATTRVARGAGLGLALVSEYVRAMRGTCGVSSEPGRGSTFFFTLPVATVAAPVGGTEGGTSA